MTCPPNADTQARQSCAAVIPFFSATFFSASTSLKLFSKFYKDMRVRQSSIKSSTTKEHTSPWKRVNRFLMSFSGSFLISPVRKPRPRGEYATTAIQSSAQVAMTRQKESSDCRHNADIDSTNPS